MLSLLRKLLEAFGLGLASPPYAPPGLARTRPPAPSPGGPGPTPPPPAQLATVQQTTENAKAAANGSNYLVSVGDDDDGIYGVVVPTLTPAEAARRAGELAAQSQDGAGALLATGLKTGLKQAPLVGGFLASTISGPEPLTAAELLNNNRIQQELATVTLVNTNLGAFGSSTPIGAAKQLDPALQDPFGTQESGAGRKRDNL